MIKDIYQWHNTLCTDAYKIEFLKEVVDDLIYLKNNYNLQNYALLQLNNCIKLIYSILDNKFQNDDLLLEFNKYLIYFSSLVSKIWNKSITKGEFLLAHSITNPNDINLDFINMGYKSKDYLSCSCINSNFINFYNENKCGMIIKGKIKIYATHHFDAMTAFEDDYNFKTVLKTEDSNLSCWESVTSLKSPKQIIEKNLYYRDEYALENHFNYNEIIIDPKHTYVEAIFCLNSFSDKEKIKSLAKSLHKDLIVY